MEILGNFKENYYDTAMTTADKSMGFAPNAINLVEYFFCGNCIWRNPYNQHIDVGFAINSPGIYWGH